MTMPLVNEKAYPPRIRDEILDRGRIARQIADRWMLGWPQRVQALIQAEQYLPALTAQREAELDALAENADNWLSETEKVQLAGLSLECPFPQD
jgi:hypothetical protein